MSDGDLERTQVNVRVDTRVKDAFDEKIIETFGTLRPYAGIELEREFRAFLDRGDVANLRAVVEDLLTVFEDTDHEKKIRERRRKESVSIGYRVSEELRHEMKSVSAEDYRSFGKLVEAIMHTYVTEGRFLQRMTEELQQVLDRAETTRDDSLGAKDRRTQTIVSVLEDSERDWFDMADFEHAIEAASGIGVSKYTKQEYLPRVLDELNYTWDPENHGRFIDREAYSVPSIRDVTSKPYLLMDSEDKCKAIKIAAYRSNTRSSPTFTVEEATAMLEGRPKRSTVKALMRDVESSAPGYQYLSEREEITVSKREVLDNPSQNLDVIAVEHTAQNWVDSAVDSLLQMRQDVPHDLRHFGEPVIDRMIAEAKYPDLLVEDRGENRVPPDYVTQSDRERVIQELTDELGEPVEIYSEHETERIKMV